jgi:hypothetical protein
MNAVVIVQLFCFESKQVSLLAIIELNRYNLSTEAKTNKCLSLETNF